MVDKKVEETKGTAVEMVDGLAENELREIVDFSTVIRTLGDQTVNISDVLGTGFSVLEKNEKMRLCNVPMVIVKYGEHLSEETGNLFASIHVVTEDGGKWIVNDGSTGICVQLRELKQAAGRVCPLYVPKGLRVSEYDYFDEAEKRNKKARTFYLNTSK